MSRRERAAWLRSLPVEQRVRLAYGENVRYRLGADLPVRSKDGPRFRKCDACGETRRHSARGLCNRCYRRRWKTGAFGIRA